MFRRMKPKFEFYFQVRWSDSVQTFREQAKMLPGDVLLVASFISYLGCFTKQYRLELFERKWIPYLKKLPKPIPLSMGYVGANVLSLLTDDALIATWNNEGLPADGMSTENATILTNSVKWPMIIDPQLQVISKYSLPYYYIFIWSLLRIYELLV